MAALYLHVPSRTPPSPVDASRFTAAVGQEINRYAHPPYTCTSFQTLYLGGGRPSSLSDPLLRTLVEALQQQLPMEALKETTLELHPADASPSFLVALRDLGITRLSIDARSLRDEELRRILHQTRETGFENVSVDLAFGGGEESLSAWKTSLHRAVALRVPHVTLHERASDGTGDEDDRADRFTFAMRFLQAKGYDQYELTHFARPGHRSQYQTHVYGHGNVLGLGPGAESFWWPDRTDPSTARRWANVSDPAAYVERLRDGEAPVDQRNDLDPSALAREYILLRLRTSEGLDLDVLADRYDHSLRQHRGATLDRLAKEGLIHDDPGRVRLTPRGRLLADAVTQRLLP